MPPRAAGPLVSLSLVILTTLQVLGPSCLEICCFDGAVAAACTQDQLTAAADGAPADGTDRLADQLDEATLNWASLTISPPTSLVSLDDPLVHRLQLGHSPFHPPSVL
ncbi:MAG: hypothetical protein AB1411_08335 [Nitrospirota bacterium]